MAESIVSIIPAGNTDDLEGASVKINGDMVLSIFALNEARSLFMRTLTHMDDGYSSYLIEGREYIQKAALHDLCDTSEVTCEPESVEKLRSWRFHALTKQII